MSCILMSWFNIYFGLFLSSCLQYHKYWGKLSVVQNPPQSVFAHVDERTKKEIKVISHWINTTPVLHIRVLFSGCKSYGGNILCCCTHTLL